jgi:hypothetical protein
MFADVADKPTVKVALRIAWGMTPVSCEVRSRKNFRLRKK